MCLYYALANSIGPHVPLNSLVIDDGWYHIKSEVFAVIVRMRSYANYQDLDIPPDVERHVQWSGHPCTTLPKILPLVIGLNPVSFVELLSCNLPMLTARCMIPSSSLENIMLLTNKSKWKVFLCYFQYVYYRIIKFSSKQAICRNFMKYHTVGIISALYSDDELHSIQPSPSQSVLWCAGLRCI